MPIVKELHIAPAARAEGDLDVQVWLRDGVVVRARARARLFAGLAKLMVGKTPAAALQIAPRICGVCGAAHQYAAAFALDAAQGARPPFQALLVRGVGQLLENLQSAPRWFYTQFAPDLLHPNFVGSPFFGEAGRRFAPYVGASYAAAMRASSLATTLYGLLAGPWPGAAYMTPGGVQRLPASASIAQARELLSEFRREWLEKVWLGDAVDSYLSLGTWSGLRAWAERAQGDLAVFLRMGLSIGLDTMGQGLGRFLAMGSFAHPEKAHLAHPEATILPAGLFGAAGYEAFDPALLADYPPGLGAEAIYRKAPRYLGQPAELGALARAVMQANPANAPHQLRDPLFGDILQSAGASALVRALARMHEMVRLYALLDTWLAQMEPDAPCQAPPTAPQDGQGFGATEAARGALAHWVALEGGLIRDYQILPPTLWNTGPSDDLGTIGPYAAALLGTRVANPQQPVEISLVMRSFDTCLLSSVQVLEADTERAVAHFTY
jgi:hydrogenase large subunit